MISPRLLNKEIKHSSHFEAQLICSLQSSQTAQQPSHQQDGVCNAARDLNKPIGLLI